MIWLTSVIGGLTVSLEKSGFSDDLDTRAFVPLNDSVITNDSYDE